MAITYKKRITWFPVNKHTSLSQAVSGGPEFCFVSDDGRQVTQFFHCKDYLQDNILGMLTDKAVSVYGFHYNPKENPPPCLDRARLLVGNSSDPAFKAKVPNCLDFLHSFESQMGMSPTKFREAANPPAKYAKSGVWVVEGDRRWVVAPPMISLYSLFIRVGFGHVIGTPWMDTVKGIINGNLTVYQLVDKGRLSGSILGIERLVKEGDVNIFGDDIAKNYPPTEIYTMHNSMGIMALSSGSTSSTMPKWNKK